jgi:hypothetical protein
MEEFAKTVHAGSVSGESLLEILIQNHGTKNKEK